jgi:ureidoglycolate hydrolase
VGTIVRVPVQPLTAKSFVEYGQLLVPRDTEPDFQGLMSVGWRADFEVTGEIRIMTLRSQYSGMRFSMLERHFDVTQTFIPLGSDLSVVAVAAPTGDEPPKPEEVRGFLLDGTAGYVLKRGTWHSLDRYPLKPPSADIVIITGRLTQEDLERNDPDSFELTEQVDYDSRFGVTFELDVDEFHGHPG